MNLYHYKARAYSPQFGRFLQTDPIGTADGWNRYSYVGNNPVNRGDPLGLTSQEATMLDVPIGHDGYDFSNGPVAVAGGGTRGRGASTGSLSEPYFQAGLTLRYREALQRIQAIDPTFTAQSSVGLPNSGRSEAEVMYLEGVLRGMERYPNLIGRNENHHIVCCYLGGPRNGATVSIPRPYHRLITNEFQGQYGYGQPYPSQERLDEILRNVYEIYPLPGIHF